MRWARCDACGNYSRVKIPCDRVRLYKERGDSLFSRKARPRKAKKRK